MAPRKTPKPASTPILLSAELISRYGLVSHVCHVSTAEVHDIIEVGQVQARGRRTDGVPAFDPVEVREVAAILTECATHDQPADSIHRAAEGSLSSCPRCWAPRDRALELAGAAA